MQTKNILTVYSNLVRTYDRIAKMFLEKNNFFCGLEWVDNIYNYYIIQQIDYSKGKANEEEKLIREL